MIISKVMLNSLASGGEEAQEFFFADTELSTDVKSPQLAASDKSAHRLHADIQPTSDRGDIEQRRAMDFMMRGDWFWGR